MWLINKIKTYSCNDRTLVKVFHVRLSEWCHQESTIEYMQLMVLNWNHFLNDGELHFLLISTSWSYKHTPVDARSRLTLQIFHVALLSYSSVLYFNLSMLCFIVQSRFPFWQLRYVFVADANSPTPNVHLVRHSVSEAKKITFETRPLHAG